MRIRQGSTSSLHGLRTMDDPRILLSRLVVSVSGWWCLGRPLVLTDSFGSEAFERVERLQYVVPVPSRPFGYDRGDDHCSPHFLSSTTQPVRSPPREPRQCGWTQVPELWRRFVLCDIESVKVNTKNTKVPESQ